MKTRFIIPLITSILILGSLGFSQPASASPGDFKEIFAQVDVEDGTDGQFGPIIFGPDGHLYVANYNQKKVLRYEGPLSPGIPGAFVDIFVAENSGGLNGPRFIDFDPLGNLYVASEHTDKVLQYDTGGQHIADPLFMSPPNGGLDKPLGITFGPDGNLYVASSETNQILQYDGTTGAFLGDFATGGNMDRPLGITFGPDGNLYVGSYQAFKVERYQGPLSMDDPGAFMGDFVPPQYGGLKKPVGITFGPDGNLYVVNPFNDQVLQYDSAGLFLSIFTNDNGVYLENSRGIAFGPDGDLYVSNKADGQVIRFEGPNIPSETVPAQVTDLSLTVISGTQIDLSWTPPYDGGSTITGYKIQSKVNGVVSTIETSFGDATTSSYSDNTLTEGDNVTYRIAAINDKGQATYSNVPPLVTTSGGGGPTVPAQVTDLSPTVISGTQVDLSWSTPYDGGSPITGYWIQHRVNGQLSTIETSYGDATTVSYSDTTLTSGDVVEYRIFAINGEGQGPFSDLTDPVTTQ